MLIAATSDLHLPRNYQDFLHAIDRMKKHPDLFLIAGDIVSQSDMSEYDKFYNIIFGRFSCPMVSIFGNNEFDSFKSDVVSKYKDIKFLDDASIQIGIGSTTVGIFGSTGSLESPTHWQKTNIPSIESIFKERVDLAESELGSMNCDMKIMMTHYAPTFKTLEGETEQMMQTMGTKAYEGVISRVKPFLVIHGHSHLGLKQSWVDTVPVFNVSFQLNRDIVLIDTQKLKPGLSRFV